MDNLTTQAVMPIESAPLLAPCPFCGNVPQLLVRANGYNELRFVIACVGPCELKEVSTGPYQMQHECVAAWNGRANAHADLSAASSDKVGRVVGSSGA